MRERVHDKDRHLEEEIEGFVDDYKEDEIEVDSDDEEDLKETDGSEDENEADDSEDVEDSEDNFEDDEDDSEDDEDGEDDADFADEDVDSADDEGDSEEDDWESDDEYVRRTYRRKRRIRNQIIAYSIVLVILAVFITGGVFAGRNIAGILKEKRLAEEQAQLQAEQEAESAHDVVIDSPEPIEIEPDSEPEPEADYLGELLESYISEMPLEDKVAGLFIVTPEALTGVRTVTQAGDGTREALNEYAVGGLIYFRHNIINEEQLKAMLSNTTSMSRYPLFLAVDEEGGSVRRVADSGIDVPQVGAMAEIGESSDAEQAYKAGMTIGTYLAELGFNLDFAPVADVSGSDNSVMGDRVFGSDAGLVADMVSNVVKGIEEAGVSSCLKHFPGIGYTEGDTHDSRVEAERTLDEMRNIDFIPFQAGIDAGADFVMVSHVIVADTGDAVPSTLSKKIVTDVLRGEMGFEGVIITDALNMAAITDYYTTEEAAVGAIAAGADMLLMPDDFHAAYNAVLAAVQDGTFPEERVNESLKRIYRIKYADELD